MGIGFCLYKVLFYLKIVHIQKFKLSEFKLPAFIIRYVRIDSAFTNREKILLVEALKEWEYKTSGLVAFNIINLDANEIYDENGDPPKEVEEQEYYEVMTIIKAYSNSKITKMVEKEHARRPYGYAHWSDFLYIAMITDRIPNDQTFRTVAMHEVGHLLGMDHLKHKKSLMYKYTDKDIETLTKRDLAHFLSKYEYKVSNRPSEVIQQLQLQEQAKPTC